MASSQDEAESSSRSTVAPSLDPDSFDRDKFCRAYASYEREGDASAAENVQAMVDALPDEYDDDMSLGFYPLAGPPQGDTSGTNAQRSREKIALLYKTECVEGG